MTESNRPDRKNNWVIFLLLIIWIANIFLFYKIISPFIESGNLSWDRTTFGFILIDGCMVVVTLVWMILGLFLKTFRNYGIQIVAGLIFTLVSINYLSNFGQAFPDELYTGIPAKPTPTPYIFSRERLWNLINDWEIDHGFQPYQEEPKLCELTEKRLEETKDNWSSPFKTDPYFYQMGEQMAKDYPTEKNMLEGWLASNPGKNNLKDVYFRYACLRCDNNRCVLLFANKLVPKQASNSQTQGEWGKAQQVDEHTWAMKVGFDDRMGTPQEIFDALNSYRQILGKGTLTWDDRLAAYALTRAREFTRLGNLDGHAGFNNYVSNIDNMKSLGFWSVGENSSYGYRLLGVHLIEWVFAGDKPHDDNQLNPSWTHVGIGVDGNQVDIIFGGSRM